MFEPQLKLSELIGLNYKLQINDKGKTMSYTPSDMYLKFDKLYQSLDAKHRDLLLEDIESGLFHIAQSYLDMDKPMFEQYKEFATKHPVTVNKYNNSRQFVKSIFNELVDNNGKLSKAFIDSVAATASVNYSRPTPNMRLCILTLPTGHEVLGKAQVLDALNDVEELGNQVAYDNAVNELWALCGTIAKLYIG